MHIVSEGDTLWDIAKKYNLEISDLANMNSINKNSVFATWTTTYNW